MRKGCPLCRGWLVLLAAAFLGLQAQAASAQPRDPWYTDMAGHWAEEYVRVLWEEGVTDAGSNPNKSSSRYLPDEKMLRNAWMTLLAGVFELSPLVPPYYNDVRFPHNIASGREVSGYIHAGGHAGFWPGSVLRPLEPLARQDAVAALIRSLGLSDFAASLSRDQVDELLGRFRDASQVEPGLRPLIATAVHLQIVEGYPDGTLRPDRHLSRAEASAIVARSALIRALAQPNPFSPDGDGFEDVTVFALKGLRNRNIRRWSLTVVDGQGRRVWGTGQNGKLPESVAWIGRHDDGSELPAGTYYYQAFLEDVKGQEHSSVKMPLEIIYRRLTAYLEPSQVLPGDAFTVTALTTGDAQKVTLAWAGGQAELSPVGEGQWRAGDTAPLYLPPDAYPVTVTAFFPGVTREVTLWLHVGNPQPPDHGPEPNPDEPGDESSVELLRVVLTD
ncbi:MAG TPA: S-layer homology domain-containing protein [Sphingobacteriaceae bacterium]|nr:S-layer homology domain-containing protein [Sphingobacteriaceae bacterium]